VQRKAITPNSGGGALITLHVWKKRGQGRPDRYVVTMKQRGGKKISRISKENYNGF